MDGAAKGGTAFLVSGRRIVATNNHVVEGGTAFWLNCADANGQLRRMPLNLLAVYPQKDLALLVALDDLPGQPLALASQYPEPATDIYAIGFPAAADPLGASSFSNAVDDSYCVPSVLKGYVSRVLNNRSSPTQLQHQTPIVQGYSGGPLITNEGLVVGVSTSIHKEANGISYAVLAADLVEFAKACSLPVHANSVMPRPTPQRQTVAPVQETLNTHSMQNSHQPPAIISPEDAADLVRAEKLLNEGAVVSARLICDRLAKISRSPEAYVCLAHTYDPEKLHELGALVEGDAAKAKLYYGLAIQAREERFAETPQVLLTQNGACDASVCKLVDQANGPTVLCQRKRSN